jgi:hypothetical protein
MKWALAEGSRNQFAEALPPPLRGAAVVDEQRARETHVAPRTSQVWGLGFRV